MLRSLRTKPRAWTFGLAAAAVALVIAAILWPSAFAPVALAFTVATSLATLALVQVRTTALARAVRAARTDVETHHKKASTWDWRLTHRLERAGVLPPEQAPAPGVNHPWKNHPHAQDLLDTGAFSIGFYKAASAHKFVNAHDAASHYLTYGIRKLISPNAYVMAEAFPRPVQDAMRRGDALAFLDHLRRPASDEFGPVFHPQCAARDGVRPGRRGIVGAFVGGVAKDTLLPVPDNSPWAGVRAKEYAHDVTEAIRSLSLEERLKKPRAITSWDHEEERRWKADVQHVSVAPGRKVTVIMPVWNRIEFVGQAIASVQRQSYRNWELVIIDDHSTDGTWEFVQALAQVDARITTVRNPSKGVSSARNAGIELATGQLLAFLDSDNEWRDDYLELMVKGMQRDQLSVAYAASQLSFGTGEAPKYMAYSGGRKHLLIVNHIDMNVLVVERSLALEVAGFDEGLRRWVDHDFAIRLSVHVKPKLLPFIGCEYEHSLHRDDRITVRESSHWQWVVLGKGLLDWESTRAQPRVPGRISVVIPTYEDHEMTLNAVDSVQREHPGDDLEVVVVDNGSSPQHARPLIHALTGRAGVQLVRLPKNYNFAIGCNYGFLHSTGEYVLFLNNDTLIRSGSLSTLRQHLADPAVAGVQPVLVYPDDTIQTAGTLWVTERALPIHLLNGHPLEDARHVAGEKFSAITAAAMLLRASDIIDLRGFDPFYVNGMEDVDFCLRLLKTRTSGFRVDPHVVVTHLESKTPGRGKEVSANRQIFMERWRENLPGDERAVLHRCGFDIARIASDGSGGRVLGPRPILVRPSAAARRWGIKNAANATRRGDGWGDTHFIDSLAAELRRNGQDVVTYRHEAHNVETTSLDDINLVIRGLDRVRPLPGQVNALWIISHPESVSEEEMREFDLVYAASETWAQEATERTGVHVRPLLQATDAERFRFRPERGDLEWDVIFVGGRHPGRTRPLVGQALDAGVDLAVYGPGWEKVLPQHVWRGAYVPNVELADYYRRSRFVLADHWVDMAKEGFVQNRVFDAVASGSRVITDPVAGLEHLFGDEVRVVRSAEDIAQLVQDDRLHQHASLDRFGASKRVLEQHSFAARARQLMQDVMSL